MPTINQKLKLPKTLYLETTNRCNLRCRGCILYQGGKEPDRDLTFEDIVMITDQLPELDRVFLHGVGEPLLNRELIEIIRHLKKRNIGVLFNTNGILLKGLKQQRLIQAELDELRISLDAATPRGYRQIRNSDKFEQIIENLRSFVKLEKQQRVSRPKLSLWFLGTKDNIAELPAFVALAGEIGVQEVYLQRLVFFQDSEGFGLARRCNTLQDAVGETSEIIAQSQDLATKFGIRFIASGLSRPSESLKGQPEDKLPWLRCYRPFTLMYITANGNVLPCCIAPFSTVDYASIIMGNIFHDALTEIWTAAKYQSFREKHQSEKPPQCCQGCGVQWSL